MPGRAFHQQPGGPRLPAATAWDWPEKHRLARSEAIAPARQGLRPAGNSPAIATKELAIAGMPISEPPIEQFAAEAIGLGLPETVPCVRCGIRHSQAGSQALAARKSCH